MLFKGLILTAQSYIGKERTSAATFHLLTGKKSIQTIQDAHLYNLQSFYGLLPTLSKTAYDNQVSTYIHKGLLVISPKDKNYVWITEKGKGWLKETSPNLSNFSGLNYFAIDTIFLNRLLLLIQVMTNSLMNFNSYIPVIDNYMIMNWMKNIFPKIKHRLFDCNKLLYQELKRLLQQLTVKESSMFVDRLTSYKNYGMSTYQLANKYDMDIINIQLCFVRITHQMLDEIIHNKTEYKSLFFIIKDIENNKFITHSANKTYELLKSNNSIQDIVQLRNLKKNTVLDHIVEIALYDRNFLIDPYVNKDVFQEIVEVVKQTNSYKLKTIKQAASENISYFQIRLVLSRLSL